MDEKKIALIMLWDHPNYVTQNFSWAISAAIQSYNQNVRYISVSQPIEPQFSNINPANISFVLCIGHEPLNIVINGKKLYDFFDCPFYVYVLDTPIYNLRSDLLIEYFKRSTIDNRLKILFAERIYLDLYSTYQLNGSRPKIEFMPFAAFPSLPLKEEKVDRLVVIGGLGTELHTHSNLLEPTIDSYNPYEVSQNQINDLIDTIEDNKFTGNATTHIVRIFRLDPEDLIDTDFLNFACAVDSYLKKRNRIRAIDSLQDCPTDFYGPGWDIKYSGSSNFRFFGEIKHTQVSEIISRYKVLLNFDPNWEDGVHDRVFTTLANGTNLITNENLFLNEIEGKSGNIYKYYPNIPNIKELAEDAIESWVDSEIKSVLLYHSWHERITTLIQNI
jgi:hypothetical protein